MPDRASSPSAASPSPSQSPPFDPIATSMADNSPASLWARLIITPLTFLSFLLSLSLIDSYTTSQLSPQSSPPTLHSRFANLLHRLLFKQNPEYKYPPSASQREASNTSRTTQAKVPGSPTKTAKVGGDGGKGNEHWHWHTHQRKLMRMEVDDAFRIRQWVLVAMSITALLLCGLSVWVGGKVVRIGMEMLNPQKAVPLSLAGVRDVHA